ncbi:Rho-GAP domain-containing protein [Caenorhabditis elegans]|nr:Rho-GAP domain-containing protein [Caenorhabditis elegans]CBK19454.1 Rho-GAP domain-containing protein [Caenorhabditis elegans]|eukprot:NP_001255759.1 Rho GTPase Activating protein [Caenorhabditis elegans]
MMEFLHDICDGQVQPITSNANSEIDSIENDRPSILSSSGIQLLAKPDSSNRSRRPKPVVNSNLRNRVTRTDPLIMSHFYSQPIEIQPAPLATPEAVDFSPAYSLVNDAVHTVIQVNGSTPLKSPPTFHSYESSTPDSRSTTSTVSGSSPAPRAVSADVTRRSRTSNVSLSTDSINRLHRTSNLFQLRPEAALTAEQKRKSLSIESLTKVPEKEKGNRFVRKVATSFRLRKSLLDTTCDGESDKKENKKKTSTTTSPEQISSFLEKMATRSLPQSPRTDRKAKLYSSLNSTTEKVSNVLSWLPSKTSKKLMKNKSATHDLSTSLINYPASTSTQGVIAANETLETLCSKSPSQIPIYLEKCIQFIEQNGGFEQEGLYRVPGNQTHLAEVEKRFLKYGEFDVSSFDTPVHVAATALKSFFSCLPESLIPTAYHLRWKQIMMVSDDIKKIDGIRDALAILPVSNQKVLQYLVTHLTKVSCSPKTVMNSNNLSKVWTPTLFRPVFASYEELSSGIIAFQLALEMLIFNSHSLFNQSF